MKKRTLELPLTLILALVMVAWYATTWRASETTMVVVDSGQGADVEQSSAVEHPGAGLVGIAEQAAGTAALRDEASDVVTVGVEGVSAARAGWWRVPKGSNWIEGRVELPDGVPGDEVIWITAEGSRFAEKDDARSSHTVRVKDDGTFRVAFSSRTRKRGRLLLRGRYCYLDEARWVSVSDSADELVLEPKLGGRVMVKVLPPRLLAFKEGVLEGIQVEAVSGTFPETKKLSGWPREVGEFEVGGMVPGKAHVVTASSSAYADGRAEGVSVEEGGTTHVDVALSLGARLGGLVVDDTGAPIDAAKVYHLSKEQAGRRIPMMRMDPEGEVLTIAGRFELEGVPPGERVLVVEADGYMDYQLDLGELSDAEERLTLDVRLDLGRVISGMVKWPDGSAGEGATVRIAQKGALGNWELERVKGEVTLGPDGRFEFTALEDDACNVTASAIHPADRPDPGSKVSRLKSKLIPRWMARAEEISPGTLNLTMTLSRGNVLTGTVVDDAGKPVKAFKVTASPEGDGMLAASSMKPVRGRFKDKSGKFALEGVQPGGWEVRVSATGYGDSERKQAKVPGADGLRFVVPRTGLISGKVLGPSGEFVEDARVIVNHGGSKNTAVDSEEEGKFVAGKIEPGWVEIVADADGFASSEMVKFKLGPAGRREDLMVYLGQGAAIIAEVHQDAGERAGRKINLSGPVRMEQETGSDGSVAFEGLDAGKYSLSLAPETSAAGLRGGGRNWIMSAANRKTADVEVLAGETVTVLLGLPSPTAVTLSGVVTRNGEPLADALVMATPKGEGDRPSAAVRSDDQGAYSLELDEPGEWRIQAGRSFRSLVSFQVEIPADKKHRLDLALPEARVVGRVTKPGGRPASGLRVTLLAADGEERRGPAWFSTRTDTTSEAGEFEFEDLNLGKYDLRVGGSDGWGIRERGAEYGRVLVEVEIEFDDESVRSDIQLSRAGKIEGFVFDAAGTPVSGARLKVTDEGGRNLSQFGNVRSGSDGGFTYEGVGPGTYLVSASKDGESEPAKIKVYEGGSTDVQLTIQGS